MNLIEARPGNFGLRETEQRLGPALTSRGLVLHVVDLDEIPGSWFRPGLDLAVVGIWEK